MGQQIFIKRAVRVGDECPSHAIYTRQSGKWLVEQHRQSAKIAARQSFVDFLELRFDQVKVVQQPFSRWADVVARACLLAYVGMRLAKHRHIGFETWKERCSAGADHRRAVR